MKDIFSKLIPVGGIICLLFLAIIIALAILGAYTLQIVDLLLFRSCWKDYVNYPE